MNSTEIALVDLSSIAHPIWHSSQSEPNPDHTSQATVERVIELTRDHVYAAICCDSGKSFRNELDPTYKATRPKHEDMASLHHQIDLARKALKHEGYPVWAVRGFEADDILATATAQALAIEDATVLVISADKDMGQLVGERVRQMSPASNKIYDVAGIQEKFGVRPSQIGDYLCLVGDSSDNIKGADKIGPKTAAMLLTTHNTIEEIYEHLDSHPSAFKPGIATSLQEFRSRFAAVRALVTLRADVEIPFAEIAAERVPAEIAPTFDEGEPMNETVDAVVIPEAVPEVAAEPITKPAEVAAEPVKATEPAKPAPVAAKPTQALTRFEAGPVINIEYERQLDPRNLAEADKLAGYMKQSGLFGGYGTVPAVLSTILVGRELRMPAMASLRGIHIVEGRHTLSAQTMVALVMKSGEAEYWEPEELTDTIATFVTKRVGARKEVRLSHTIEMATRAGLVKPNSNWVKTPEDMLVARCTSRLIKIVYADIVGGFYTKEEMEEVAEARMAA